MIYVLTGRSAVGKDTIYKELTKDESLGLERLVTCTTRKMRPGETDGVEYWFKSDDEFEQALNDGDVIEFRTYPHTDGVVFYYTTKGCIDVSKNYIVIGTLESLKSYTYYFGEENVKGIFLTLDENELFLRAFEREQRTTKNYKELCRRFMSDCEEFSEEILNRSNIGLVICNENVPDTLDCIKKYIS